MTEEEIFKRAMENALANGLRLHFSEREIYQKILDKKLPFWVSRSLILWQPFAIAFWGKSWRKHLQQLVVAEDKYKYLEEFLGN
jgi:hypothetical protein